MSCAQIAQAELREANQNVRELLLICNEEHKNLLTELKMLGQMIERGEENEADTSPLVEHTNELFA